MYCDFALFMLNWEWGFTLSSISLRYTTCILSPLSRTMYSSAVPLVRRYTRHHWRLAKRPTNHNRRRQLVRWRHRCHGNGYRAPAKARGSAGLAVCDGPCQIPTRFRRRNRTRSGDRRQPATASGENWCIPLGSLLWPRLTLNLINYYITKSRRNDDVT